MQSQQQIEQFRRMTPAQRLAIWSQLADQGMEIWQSILSAEEIERRWAIWRRDHDLSDEAMLRGFREER
jgi:hypothetical protein